MLVAKKTKQHLTPLQGRKFAGFLLGQLDGPTLLGKIKEIMLTQTSVSPYFVTFDPEQTEVDFNICVDATAIGLSGDQVIYKSGTEIDGNAALVCVPGDSSLGPVILKMGTNLVKGEDIYNVFPVARIKGKGRKWITKLPMVDLNESPDADLQEEDTALNRVIFFDPNQKRFDQFKEVLAGYNIELMHANSARKAAQMMERGDAQCVYLHEMTVADRAVVNETLGKVQEPPTVIVGTSSMNVKSNKVIRYIQKPFGLGVLVEMMQTAFQSGKELSDKIDNSTESANLECSYQAPAKLIGVDETGGIIQLKFPVVKGSRLKLEHPFLSKIWDGDTLVEITHTANFPDAPSIWQARFEAVSSKGNKAKYWEKVEKLLADFLPPVEEKESA